MTLTLTSSQHIVGSIWTIADRLREVTESEHHPSLYRGLYHYLYGRVQANHGHDMDAMSANARMAHMSTLRYLQEQHPEVISDVVYECNLMMEEEVNPVVILLLSIPRDYHHFYQGVAQVL